MYYSDRVYEGQFINGLRHGNGTIKWNHGHQYRGEFRNDKVEGKGE
jgi:hypothetical protein